MYICIYICIYLYIKHRLTDKLILCWGRTAALFFDSVLLRSKHEFLPVEVGFGWQWIKYHHFFVDWKTKTFAVWKPRFSLPLRGLPDFVQPAVEPVVYGAMTQALKMKVPWSHCRVFAVCLMQKKAMTCLKFLSPKVDFKTELRWEKSDYDGSKILQAKDATPGRILSP